MGNAVPTLSTKGWVTDAYYKADVILSYFFLSDASQSNVYFGRIATLPNCIKEAGNDDLALKNSINTALTQMFTSRVDSKGKPTGYFDNAVVDVTVKRTETGDSVNQDISISIILTEGEKKYSLGKLVNVSNSTIKTIIDINNG